MNDAGPLPKKNQFHLQHKRRKCHELWSTSECHHFIYKFDRLESNAMRCNCIPIESIVIGTRNVDQSVMHKCTSLNVEGAIIIDTISNTDFLCSFRFINMHRLSGFHFQFQCLTFHIVHWTFIGPFKWTVFGALCALVPSNLNVTEVMLWLSIWRFFRTFPNWS